MYHEISLLSLMVSWYIFKKNSALVVMQCMVLLLLMLYLALVALRLLHEHAFVVCFNWVAILECVTIGWIPAKQYY